jgi:hypothetical protein
MATSMTPTQRIAAIDRRIDGVRLELFRRGCRFNTMSAHGWQIAWDRHPDLGARNDFLYRLRGLAQLDRDAEIERTYRADQRRARAARRRAA